MTEKLTAAQAAKILGVSIETVKRWCREEKLVASKFGWAWQIDADSVHEKKRRG
jgi:excisionase family DNA binding protein